jgi:hypothetical protein
MHSSQARELELERQRLILDEREREILAHERWTAGDLTYKMHRCQLIVHERLRNLPREARWRIAECGRGWGKSWLDVMMALEDASQFPNDYPVWIIGPELKQTRRIVEPIMRVITADAPPGMVRHLASEDMWEVTNPKTGCKNWILLGGFNLGSYDKWRGQRGKSFFLEEARDIKPESYLEGVVDTMTPMAMHSWGGITIFTTVPRELDHPYDSHTVPAAKLHNAYLQFTIHDNPTIDDDQKAQIIRDMGGEDSPSYKREHLCLRVRDGSLAILPSFDSARQVRELTPPDFCHWVTCIDGGGIEDKTVAQLCYWDFERACFCIYDEEAFEPNTASDIIAERIFDMERRNLSPHTPAGERMPKMLEPPRPADLAGQTRIDLFRLHGLSTQTPMKDDLEASVNVLEVASRRGKLEVHPRCKLTVVTFEHGRFTDNRRDLRRTKELGHCDAFMSAVYGHRAINRTNPWPVQEVQSFRQVVRTQPADPDVANLARALKMRR